jgi:segregation and condensation protein A
MTEKGRAALLLLPEGAVARRVAGDEADLFRKRLSGLAEIQALAAWLDRRPHLGHDVFTRGQPPEGFGPLIETGPEIDVIEFLWASMALFDDGTPGPDTSEVYRPRRLELYSIAAARARILKRPDGLPMELLLPQDAGAAGVPAEPARRRAAWTSTFIAGLELAKQGDVAMAQEGALTAIHVSPTPTEQPR